VFHLTLNLLSKHQIQEIERFWNKSLLSQSDLQKKQERLGDNHLVQALSLRLASVSFADNLSKERKHPTTIFKFMKDITFSSETRERKKYVNFFIQSIMGVENPIKSKNFNNPFTRSILGMPFASENSARNLLERF
jgi:hypothetical protein